ncbi:hypothetical protein [Neolewinella antarctica]|uniref:EF-hand domain-containing protein n=1 Tax=Neolewinella antarctica TaxID=442734 RepID=A0ABX0X6G5_9BACT|nr:hypothetical protein [Neolewinella antarctica]NJC24810.1 hypothetical protein [Neolewinella antarctica]
MSTEIQAHGVENAKQFITILGGQVYSAATIDKNGDGEISTGEWTGFGSGFAMAVFTSFSIVSASLPEFGDLKGKEFDELTDHVLATDFLPDDKEQAEVLVKYVLHVANTNRKFAIDLIGLSRGEKIALPVAA